MSFFGVHIKQIIRKTLIYLTVIATLGIISLGVATFAAHLFGGLASYQAALATGVSAIIFSCCFPTFLKQVQTGVDSQFFRQYIDREEKLYELSREVITHTTADAMGDALMRVIMEALRPKKGTLFLRSRDSAGFVRISGDDSSVIPKRMEELNELTRYFRDHPQPFVQNIASDVGSSQSTRVREKREDAS